MPEVSFASLSPSLLARKGGAKPAMRPQHAALAAMPASLPAQDAERLEDLGWNDMGDHDDGAAVASPEALPVAEVVTLAPSAADQDAEPLVIPAPAVLRQREEAAARIAPQAPPVATRAVAQAAPRGRKDRAAFTLRLDTQRHIKLRLACTVRGMSAQALVTEALDAMLGDMPELESLAAHLKRC